jgi:hypothetical protein
MRKASLSIKHYYNKQLGLLAWFGALGQLGWFGGFGGFGRLEGCYLKSMVFAASQTAHKDAKSVLFKKLHINLAKQSIQSNSLVWNRCHVQLHVHRKKDAWDESLSNPIPTLFQVQNHFVSMLPKHLL